MGAVVDRRRVQAEPEAVVHHVLHSLTPSAGYDLAMRWQCSAERLQAGSPYGDGRLIGALTVEVRMLSKWMCGNRLAVRVVASAGGMTALAVVLAAPSKWI
jgi:hypothetical protein